ncbi:hypothetical protein SH528x_004268 [Novipirellula sp. SH528]|uniref:hypothetical protein n=1 Tax=Novipirellula sp. SH528 TaxID=3454466 RepID=UPI003FA18D89
MSGLNYVLEEWGEITVEDHHFRPARDVACWMFKARDTSAGNTKWFCFGKSPLPDGTFGMYHALTNPESTSVFRDVYQRRTATRVERISSVVRARDFDPNLFSRRYSFGAMNEMMLESEWSKVDGDLEKLANFYAPRGESLPPWDESQQVNFNVFAEQMTDENDIRLVFHSMADKETTTAVISSLHIPIEQIIEKHGVWHEQKTKTITVAAVRPDLRTGDDLNLRRIEEELSSVFTPTTPPSIKHNLKVIGQATSTDPEFLPQTDATKKRLDLVSKWQLIGRWPSDHKVKWWRGRIRVRETGGRWKYAASIEIGHQGRYQTMKNMRVSEYLGYDERPINLNVERNEKLITQTYLNVVPKAQIDDDLSRNILHSTTDLRNAFSDLRRELAITIDNLLFVVH